MASTRKTLSCKTLSLTPMAALGMAAALTPQAAHADGTLTTIISGLSGPYGMTFGSDGGLYVAEAGTGGTGPSFVNGNGQTVFFGDTGSVVEYVNGALNPVPVVSALPSLAPQGPGDATGLTSLAFEGGDLYGVFGLGGTEADRTALENGLPSGNNANELGTIVNLTTGAIVSDLVPYETQNYAANNPGGTGVEANPYGLTALPNGTLAATDGGGNVVLTTSTTPGSTPALLSALKTVPPQTYQSVPTAITTGPGGDLYAAEFTGYPFPAGGADILKIDPTTGATSVFASGFTGIVGAAFGANGDLYVLDTSAFSIPHGPTIPDAGPAELLEYDPTDGATTTLTDLAPGTYTGLLAGPGDTLYISSQGPNGGIVQRFIPAAVPEAPPFGLLALGLLPVGLRLRARRKAGTA